MPAFHAVPALIFNQRNFEERTMAEAAKTKGNGAQQPKYSESVRVADFKIAEAERNQFEVFVDDDTPIELLTGSRYWSHIADKLTTRDLIYVQPRNGRWLAILRVQHADRRSRDVQVFMLQKFDLPEVKPAVNTGLPAGGEVRFINAQDGYGAFHHGTLMRDGFRESEAAAEYIRGHAALR